MNLCLNLNRKHFEFGQGYNSTWNDFIHSFDSDIYKFRPQLYLLCLDELILQNVQFITKNLLQIDSI